ncbi:lysophospholipase [Aspergillus leporis]|jgi:lysophospholipase|uniref:Lysophospholipase n=1 Tax=Aspergillus leporis TaxID=41062 RepID=A0A5N5X0E3_9EURO|nr:lysophospholipase [Aspergillus leporis]
MIIVPLLTLAAGISAAPSVVPRALPNAPDGYAPDNVTCPVNRPRIRNAASLSSNETDWLKLRREETIQPMKDLLSRLNLSSFDTGAYIDRHSKNISNLPNIGISVSGGGYRALTNGAGAIKAFDSRTSNSTAVGQLGGLLQSATYVSGLSGGGWLLGSIFINNFTTIHDLQVDRRVWDFKNSILEGPDVKHFQLLTTASYWKDLHDAVKAKKEAGYDTSLTDYWGRALSYQFINSSTDDGGLSYTWSSIASMESFQQGKIPMPVLVADGRNPGETVIGSNSTVYEFNPWEFGTFDPSIFGFAPLEYLGSPFNNGQVPNDTSCVRGFDNAGFVMGTSSSLFNQFILRLNNTNIPEALKSALQSILQEISQDEDDIAIYSPNPFKGYCNHQYCDSPKATVAKAYSKSSELNVVDGGEDGQNIPLHPLIQPTRQVDVIFAVDSTANIHNWPSGKSLVRTYERSLNSTGIGNGSAFPSVPDPNTFVNLGLNNRPTFFGCDSKNLTGTAPLIVYLPNSPYTAQSNTSTFKLSYTNEERDSVITNGYNVVTRGNASVDSNWPSCVGCAILSRSAERTNTTLPEICTTCFNTYCWNGTINSTEPSGYEPVMALQKSAGNREQMHHTTAVVAFALAVIMII